MIENNDWDISHNDDDKYDSDNSQNELNKELSNNDLDNISNKYLQSNCIYKKTYNYKRIAYSLKNISNSPVKLQQLKIKKEPKYDKPIIVNNKVENNIKKDRKKWNCNIDNNLNLLCIQGNNIPIFNIIQNKPIDTSFISSKKESYIKNSKDKKIHEINEKSSDNLEIKKCVFNKKCKNILKNKEGNYINNLTICIFIHENESEENYYKRVNTPVNTINNVPNIKQDLFDKNSDNNSEWIDVKEKKQTKIKYKRYFKIYKIM